MNDKQSFLELVNELYTENRESALRTLVCEFKSQNNLIEIFKNECKSNETNDLKSNEFKKVLINLPQITGNIFQLLNDPMFISDRYYSVLCNLIYQTLKEVHQNLEQGQNQNLWLISQLIGQICFNRFENIFWSKIGAPVLENSKQDLIWRKIGRRLIKQQNPLYLESLIKQLLLNVESPEQLEWYLGAELATDDTATIKYLLSNKFLLINHFSVHQHRFIENLIGYLINYNVDLYKQTLHNVISVLSNAAFVRHQTKDQHHYLCRVLVCCLKYMINIKFKLDPNQFQSMILHAAETHLKMVELDKRNRGLFVVQRFTNYLNEGIFDEKLDFEIEFDDDIKFMVEIIEGKKQVNQSDDPIKRVDEHFEERYQAVNEIDLDENDDDLIPFDMSNDTPLIKTKKPIYLKDCLEGLVNKEDSEYNSICLECLPDLIEKNKPQASEMAVDFIRVLLFLDCEDDESKSIQTKSLIKICNLNPKDAAQYLTSQFYDQNMSIARKLEILDVIVESAKQLSSLENKPIEDTKIKSIQNIFRQKKPEYEKIIEERLKSKTKILCSSHKMPLSFRNEFISIVSHYFYPLINNFDKKGVTLRFNEDDYFVLGKLMITLAELLKSVSQTHVTRKMAIALVDFLESFKNHQESYVRKAITVCIHSIITNVPNYFLFEQLQTEMLSLRDYLISLKHHDSETFHSHGVLTLYALEEQINDYQNKLKIDQKTKKN